MTKTSDTVCDLPFGGRIYMMLNDANPPIYEYFWYNSMVIGEFGPFVDSAAALRHYKCMEMSVTWQLSHPSSPNIIQVDFKAKKRVTV